MLSNILSCHDATFLVFRGKHERQSELHVQIVVVSEHDEVSICRNDTLLQFTLQTLWHHGILQVWVDVNYEALICLRLYFHTKG